MTLYRRIKLVRFHFLICDSGRHMVSYFLHTIFVFVNAQSVSRRSPLAIDLSFIVPAGSCWLLCPIRGWTHFLSSSANLPN